MITFKRLLTNRVYNVYKIIVVAAVWNLADSNWIFDFFIYIYILYSSVIIHGFSRIKYVMVIIREESDINDIVFIFN